MSHRLESRPVRESEREVNVRTETDNGKRKPGSRILPNYRLHPPHVRYTTPDFSISRCPEHGPHGRCLSVSSDRQIQNDAQSSRWFRDSGHPADGTTLLDLFECP